MDSNDTLREAGEATAEFERNLETLLMEAFAEGAAVEGSWKIKCPVAAVPDWTVEIAKSYSDQDADYEPEFIDE